MKKKILGGVAVIAIAALAAFNMNVDNNKQELSAISLANVEALASGEAGGGNGEYRWHGNECKDGTRYECCTSNGNGNSCSSPGDCTRKCN